MVQYCKQIDPHTTVFGLTGPLNQQATLGLKALILGAKEFGAQHIILDLSSVTWISWFALDQFLLWHFKMKSNYLHFSIVNPSPNLRESLKQSNIANLVPIFTSQDEAIKHHEASSS